VRILVVEDDENLARAVKRGLQAEGFAVNVASDGNDGLWRARDASYDAIVLDIMLPGLNGYELCARLRAEGNWAPILMLTAKDGDLDEAEALDTGADDFLSKPFSYVVLLARLRALVRRGRRERPPALEAGDLRLDPAAHQVWRDETPIHLTPRQFSLLERARGLPRLGVARAVRPGPAHGVRRDQPGVRRGDPHHRAGSARPRAATAARPCRADHVGPARPGATPGGGHPQRGRGDLRACPRPPRPGAADREELTRLVRNLLENAERHAASIIRVRLSASDGGVLLVVEDDGPGVPPEQRERIFDRFARVDDARTRATGGTGLGLAIVKSIAERYGGTVSVENATAVNGQGGARFAVRLARQVPGDVDAAAARARP
jgi:two-component system OmpR family response regulator